MEETLSSLMIADHASLNVMLKTVESLVFKGEYLQAQKEFIIFKEHFQKHILIEEKAVNIIFEKMSGKDTSHIFEIMQEHSELQSLMNTLKDNFSEGINVELISFEEKLRHHINFENKSFYPKLEHDFDDFDKTKMMEEIKKL